MAKVTSLHAFTTVSYPAGVACRDEGAEATELVVSADGTRGWVDVGKDGSVDALRDGDRFVVASRLVPGWASPTEWISIPTVAGDPVAKVASLSSPLKPVIASLLSAAKLADTVSQVESEMGPAKLGGDETVNGRHTTRYEFKPAKAHDVSARVWIADDDALVRLQVTNTQDPRRSSVATLDVIGLDEPVVVNLPADGSITPLGQLAAAPVMLSQPDSDPACFGPDRHAAVDARRACIQQAAQDHDVDSYAHEFIKHPLDPYGCTLA